MTRLEFVLAAMKWVSVSDYFTTVSSSGVGFILFPEGGVLRLLAIPEDKVTQYVMSGNPLGLLWRQGDTLPVLFDILASDEFIALVLLSTYPEIKQ
jgi:hypothetical protein